MRSEKKLRFLSCAASARAAFSVWLILPAQNALPVEKPKRQHCGTTVAVKTASKAVDRQSQKIEPIGRREKTSPKFCGRRQLL
jgi:hypothetical protein